MEKIKTRDKKFYKSISSINIKYKIKIITYFNYYIDQLRSHCMKQNILAQDELRYCYIFNVKQNDIFICNFVFKINWYE